MRVRFLLAVFCLNICLFLITGCQTPNLGPGPTVLQGPKPPSKAKPEVPDKPQRLTAPDEEATLGPTPLSAAQTVNSENLGSSVSQRTPIAGVKTTAQMIFTGTVTRIDTALREIAIKSSDKYLAFDLITPVLRGYDDIKDIKVGDTVSLGYVPNGLAIVRGNTFPDDLRPQTAADNLSPPKTGKKIRQTANNRGAPVRVKYKVNRLSFADIDNNKDGKISPVELGAVLPSVTIDDFKRYDRNGDGGLDTNEYKAVRK